MEKNHKHLKALAASGQRGWRIHLNTIQMKNIKRLILLSFFGVLSACSLEEDPKGLQTPEQFFQNESEVEQFTMGAYAPLRNYEFYGMSWWNRAEAINDQVTARENLKPGFLYDQPGDGFPLLWKWIYTGVNSANMLISSLEDAPLDDEVKNRYLAEARFLRGFYYFHLQTGYGKVPLILEDTPFNAAVTMGRNEVDEVWEQIKADMTFAVENGVEDFGTVKSRGTKWSAMALLSRMYLYKHEYQNAADAAQAVMESGKYDLMQNFGDVFLEENEAGIEVVFSVEFLANVGTSSYASFFTTRSDYEKSTTPGKTWNGWASNRVAEGLPGMFEEGDLRKDQTVINVNVLDNNKPFERDDWNFGPKFWDFNNPRAASAKDFLVMRYAEVLLNFAEAENEANGPTEAAHNALNKVRVRAGLDPLLGLNQEQFRQAVRHERGVELVGEGHRKWDLVRWGIWLETMKSLPDHDILPEGRNNISSRFELFPIPDVEIAKNPNLLPNNPGY